MKRSLNQPRLQLVRGGKGSGVEGPITRLGLWQDFKPLSRKHIACLFLPKFVLLAVILYFLFQR